MTDKNTDDFLANNKPQIDLKHSERIEASDKSTPEFDNLLFPSLPEEFLQTIANHEKEYATLLKGDRARVWVIYENGERKAVIELPTNITIRNLLPALINALNLPKKTNYKLMLEIKDGLLNPDDEKTLSDVNIQKVLNLWIVEISTSIVLASKLGKNLTANYLVEILHPYLAAIAEIQQILNELNEYKQHEVIIKSIQQHSPISVSLDGAAEAIQLVKDTVIPWRRKHTETMAHFLEQEKLANIEIARAEILEKRAGAAKTRAEVDKLNSEIQKEREETEKLKLENEKLRLELQQDKIKLFLDVVNKVNPNLSEVKKISHLIKIMPFLDTLVSSELEIVSSDLEITG